jgi:hypothetical protein
MNMQNPVAMPKGGMTIFFSETALRASRRRQMMTATMPVSAMRMEVPEGKAMQE